MNHRNLKRALGATFLAMLALLALACRGPLGPQATATATGTITGQALLSGRADHSGIAISAEPTDGVKSLSVQRMLSGESREARSAVARTTTDSSGAFRLSGLAPGDYVVTATSDDSLEKAVSATVSVAAGQSARALVLCLTLPGQISGTATLSDAASLPNRNLGIVVFIAGTSYSALTAADGSYTISGVPPGKNYTLVASKEGYESAIGAVNVWICQTTTAAPFALAKSALPVATGSLSGRASLSDGPPHSGVFVYLEGTSAITVTGATGAFTLAGVLPGSYTIVASKPGYDTASSSIAVSAGTVADAGELTLARPKSEVSPPSFSPGSGTYSGRQDVTISASPAGVFIRYTTDGSNPTSGSGTVYAGTPLTVAGTTVLKAIAFFPGWSDSPVSSAEYVLQVAAPVFSPAPGSYYAPQSVSIATATPGASIRYTTDGSTPTASTGILYAAPISVSESLTLKAIACLAGWTDSPPSTAAYDIQVVLPQNPTSLGEPVEGYPNWAERTLLTYQNLVRMAPQTYKSKYLGWTSSDPALSTWTATLPLYWELNLSRAARYHVEEMELHGYLGHNSFRPGETTNPSMPFYERVAMFGASAQGENVAGGLSPWGAIAAFMDDRSVADTPFSSYPVNGHRYNIMNPASHTVGAGYNGLWTVDFSSTVPTSMPPIPMASHDFISAGQISFWMNFYDPSGLSPQFVRLILDGVEYPVGLDAGTASAGTYRIDLPVSATTRKYHFLVVDGSGNAWRFPGPGSFQTVGEGSETTDYVAEP